jgi:hypothetical protein
MCMSDDEVRRCDKAQHLPLRDGRDGGGVQEVEGAREGQRRVGWKKMNLERCNEWVRMLLLL